MSALFASTVKLHQYVQTNTTPTETTSSLFKLSNASLLCLVRELSGTESINGSGGVRIEGAFEGEIAMRGMLVVGETDASPVKRTRQYSYRGGRSARQYHYPKTGNPRFGTCLGDVVTTAFVTEEGAFLRVKFDGRNGRAGPRACSRVDTSEAAQAESIAATQIVIPEPLSAVESTQKVMRSSKKKGEM